jgi:16S rRNA (guanine527-N7)-methyltransferase
MEKNFTLVFLEGARALGVELHPGSPEAFHFFMEELMRWNRKMNLTSITDPLEIVVKHFLDSLAVAPYLSPGGSLLDVGSGAGFPSLVLKICDPSLQVTSIDSSGKKLSFQRHLIRQLDLKGIDAVQAHLPNAQLLERLGRSFDYAISRALGSLGAFLRIASPFIKDTGIIIAMKGTMGFKEAVTDDTTSTMKALNIRLQRAVKFALPFMDASRTLLFFAGWESWSMDSR